MQHIKLNPKNTTVLLFFTAAIWLTACAKNIETLNVPADSSHEASLAEEDANYIVVLHRPRLNTGNVVSLASVQLQLSDLSLDHRLTDAVHTFSRVLQGGVYRLSPEQALALKKDSRVAYLEKDQIVSISATQASPLALQASPPWGLDRLDQVSLPLDQTYQTPSTSLAQVNAYIIDTGVLLTHQEFTGRSRGGYDVDG